MRKKGRKEILALLKKLVEIRTDRKNAEIVPFLRRSLRENGWKNIKSARGSVWGKIGSGKRILVYDIHSDTVKADSSQWKYPPFKATIREGFLYARGAVDDKGPLASAIFSGNFIKAKPGIAVYLLAAAAEEKDEGFGFRTFLKYEKVRPNFALVSEPSSLNLAVGQRGRFEMLVSFRGIPAHGSMPEKGRNAIYSAADLLMKSRKLKFKKRPPFPPASATPTIVKTSGDGKNVLPNSCEILFDVRISPRDDPECVKNKILGKMSPTVQAKVGKFCPAWVLPRESSFRRMCEKAYKNAFGKFPRPYYWKFCTNASEYAKMKIPVAGFGPGAPEEAHRRNEKISLVEVEKAVAYFAALPDCLK
ncbi:MAG: M20/M25/M40 family metallo-hydrolase [Elusimicrobia bacterium]|nr:M20/M25/M40 family metallo-hydrolase [Elusimicrobiota bacterium]